MEHITDPENYRKMSEPFASADEANAALKEFMAGVRELRKKHRIADVLTVVAVNAKYESGEGRAITHGFNGNSQNAEGMAAYAYGQESADRREWMNRLMSGKKHKAQDA